MVGSLHYHSRCESRGNTRDLLQFPQYISTIVCGSLTGCGKILRRRSITTCTFFSSIFSNSRLLSTVRVASWRACSLWPHPQRFYSRWQVRNFDLESDSEDDVDLGHEWHSCCYRRIYPLQGRRRVSLCIKARLTNLMAAPNMKALYSPTSTLTAWASACWN